MAKFTFETQQLGFTFDTTDCRMSNDAWQKMVKRALLHSVEDKLDEAFAEFNLTNG